MLTLFLRPVRMLFQALIGNDTPRQTAWGFSLGMMVGLLPKGNLTAIAIAMILCSLRVNRAAGFLAIVNGASFFAGEQQVFCTSA